MPTLLERMLLLPSALLTLSMSHALGYALGARDPTPTPVSIAADQNWDGIDGSWSSFTLRVGTPPQDVRTFVSWAGYQTWVVIPQGCELAADYHSCSSSRGWIFNNTASTTWKDIGIFEFGIEKNLGYTGNAEYGYDVVGLGGPGEGGPTLKNTTVGGFAVEDYYLGVFGVNPKPTNFTSFNDPSTSYMAMLREQNLIPSLSFGYTAGAPYRFTGELASLTLGGYDASKFVENDVTWTFSPDNSRDTIVAIQGITTPSQVESSPNPTSLMPFPIYAYLDATVPQIWLPVEACKAFEMEFGLIFDNDTQLYLVNDTLHQDLLKRNASITFILAKEMSGGATISIELPYAAFDLTATAPYQGLSSDSSYFPLRRAANDTQYTIGRTFFQEAYISIDYETAQFNVSQCAWNQGAQTRIVTIPTSSNSDAYSYYEGSSSSNSSSSGLSGAQIAGIAIGVVVIFALVAAASLFIFRHRIFSTKRAEQHEKLNSESGSTRNTANATPNNGREQEELGYQKAELEAPQPPSDRVYSSGGMGSSATTSGGTNTPLSPRATSGSTWGRFDSNSDSAISPSGEETHSSTQSNGVGTMFSTVSPNSPAEVCEADSKQREVFEMVGDMPVVREKDGRALTDKEAQARRELLINGVESPPASAAPPEYSERGQRASVSPEDVVTSSTVIDHSRVPGRPINFSRHRAFSFEESAGQNQDQDRGAQEESSRPADEHHEDSEEDLYS